LRAPVLAGTSATAAPIDKGHFHDVGTSDVYTDCGFPAQDSFDVSGNFVFNLRGSSPFPYYRESVRGTVVTHRERRHVHQRLHGHQQGPDDRRQRRRNHHHHDVRRRWLRFYDTDGKLVLKDPGEIRFSVVIDYMGTPGNPDDDVFVEDSFQLVRPSTGNSDFSDRDFCADLLEFTTVGSA
jgi:hypothetical protein